MTRIRKSSGALASRLMGCAALGALALAIAPLAPLAGQNSGPESLLPPGFDEPARPSPTPSARPSSRPSPRPSGRATPTPTPSAAAAPAAPQAPPPSNVVADPGQSPDLPDYDLAVPQADTGIREGAGPAPVLIDLPPQPEGDPEEILDEFSMTPGTTDLPPAAQRSLRQIGVISDSDGGLPAASIGTTGGRSLRKLVASTQGPFVSRWGAILARRALLSRLDTPRNINGADWVAARADLLLRMGEADAARALIQEVDTRNFTPRLYDVAMQTYLATADPVGLCPIVAGGSAASKDPQWIMARAICAAFSGDQSTAVAQIDRAGRQKLADKVDLLLAEKLIGAAANGRRAVKVEWDGVDTMTPWRFGMALATGLEPPEALFNGLPRRFAGWRATAPMVPPAIKVGEIATAGGMGVLSSAAMVDILGQAYDSEDTPEDVLAQANELQAAYAAETVGARLSALEKIWARGETPLEKYGQLTMTAYAAARIPVTADNAEYADQLVAAMLAAGLDRNALRWGRVVPTGSQAWAMLVLAAPERETKVSEGSIDSFADNDDSDDQRKTAFLLAGLAGLNRVTPQVQSAVAEDLGINLGGQTRWTKAIVAASERNDQAHVALLVAAGMQGDDWSDMTPRHLYHIVSALRRCGLTAEARMIAAEAVARG